ncbi:BZ3500_MvSof-1268-A1-R1_Chr10-1g02715 [Microbotryum saponariae]|uniref:BZ3500_MvSof-1268-A1-R1_Chr10-1g02715 protein n=1 Tax=Microbotryum saponariae TaxID=289078 RepID=A0A2X0N992_9BASI|nr:BZ3500_MvSof-1268-A1-R1_Chr10-1g02715 [Microbotryum saponariae]SDA06204.1 BZ3501_MvSof-1269-A2-R1_Chr10-1g02316 [Microbotryum saponariae]
MSGEELADSVCVLFCRGNLNLAELDKCRPMIVKQSRIQKMLRWLINESKNPAYSAVSFFNGERLAQLVRCNSGVLNSTSPAPTAVSASTSASASVSVAPQVSDGQTSDGDTAMWPHLDPFGLFGVCVERDVKISLEEQVKLWLNLYDSDFRCDPSFPFIISNILRRRDVFRHLAFRVPKEKVARISAALLEIYRISTVFWRFVQAHTYFNQARQAPHARFQFVPHRIRVHARNKPLFMQVSRTIN